MARVSIRLPEALRAIAAGASEIPVTAATVGEALGALAVLHPALARGLVTPDARLRRGFVAFLNGEDVRRLERERTRLAEGDLLELVAAAPGG